MLSEFIQHVIEENEATIEIVEEGGDELCAEMEWYSPAGEDVVSTIWFDGTDEGFVRAIEEYAYYFDVDEHVEFYVGMRGERGVPESISDLVDDARAIKEWLENLGEELRKAL